MNQYYDDYEQLICETVIQAEKDGYYAFEKTVFYGEKGGMPSDSGTINQLPVIDLKWEDDVLYHKVAGTLSNPIMMQVDSERRYQNTAVQSALHLLDGYFEAKGLYLSSVGVNPENQWFEVNSKEVNEEMLDAVEKFMNEAIHQEIPCQITYMKGSEYPDVAYHQFEELRLVRFGEINTQPCGTLHVHHTGQIESFTILDHEKTSKGTRVYFTCHHVSNRRLKAMYEIVKETAKIAGVKKEELCNRVSELSQSVKQYKKELADVKKTLMKYEAQALLERKEPVIHYETKDANEIRSIAQAMMNQITGNQVIIAEIGSEVHLAIISSVNEARTILERIKESLDIVGGGSPKIVTVKTTADLQTVEKTVIKVLSELEV